MQNFLTATPFFGAMPTLHQILLYQHQHPMLCTRTAIKLIMEFLPLHSWVCMGYLYGFPRTVCFFAPEDALKVHWDINAMLSQVLLYMAEIAYIGYLFFALFATPTITVTQCPWLHPSRNSNDHL